MSKYSLTANSRPLAALIFVQVSTIPVFSNAAPLDTLLTARNSEPLMIPQVEFGVDLADRKIDLFDFRPKRADGTYGPSGVYRGAHLGIGVRVHPRVWIDAQVFRRDIEYVSFAGDITSWQAHAQWLVFSDPDNNTSAAIRVGAWGNQAPQLRRNTSTKVKGNEFTSVTAKKPGDLQLQLDTIATTKVTPALSLSGFAGFGFSKVYFDQVSATRKSGSGCVYDVQFTDSDVIQTCTEKGVDIRISTPNAVTGIDVNREGQYRSRFVSAGVNVAWVQENWMAKAGVSHTYWKRDNVDKIVELRGGKAYRSNTILMAELGYRLSGKTTVFMRNQLMTHQFVGEIPLNYNTLTARSHRNKYGLLTVGVVKSF
ncbi:hypothetical protein ACG0Z6_02185 [Roseateles sp. BYS180W]|uniref:Porin n=1 Tax=Roseateles rivi TaxID=3299028 RepID=A0ABW7FRT8_9BURK